MERLKLYILFILLVPILNGCWFDQPEIQVQTKVVQPRIPLVTGPKPVQLNNIKYYVVNEETYGYFAETFVEKNGELVFVAISVQDYENLAFNVAELRRYINQQKEIITYYEDAVRIDTNTTKE